jgi:hypothetical protein
VRALELEAPGVVCVPVLGVPGAVQQLVLDGGLSVVESLWPWRKDPEILKDPKGHQSHDKGRIVCLEVMRQPGQAVVRKAPSPESCCS